MLYPCTAAYVLYNDVAGGKAHSTRRLRSNSFSSVKMEECSALQDEDMLCMTSQSPLQCSGHRWYRWCGKSADIRVSRLTCTDWRIEYCCLSLKCNQGVATNLDFSVGSARTNNSAASSWPLHKVLTHVSSHLCGQLCWLSCLCTSFCNELALLHCLAKLLLVCPLQLPTVLTLLLTISMCRRCCDLGRSCSCCFW